MATLTESNIATELGDQRIIMVVGERGVGKTHLASVLRSNMEVEHVQVPVYPTNNPLLDTLLSPDIGCDVEYVYADRITLSTQRDVIPQIAALYGDVVSAAVASRIHRVFVFIETRKFLRFLSYQDYCKYVKDPSSTCGSNDVSWIPENNMPPPPLNSAPQAFAEQGSRLPLESEFYAQMNTAEGSNEATTSTFTHAKRRGKSISVISAPVFIRRSGGDSVIVNMQPQ